MSSNKKPRVGYVLKRYPRYSETFIVNEILAHEAAGLELEILALRPPSDTHFQDRIARVRAPVTYLPSAGVKGGHLWEEISAVGELFPNLWDELRQAQNEDVRDIHQALLLARLAHERKITHLHAHFATVSTTIARLAARIAGLTYSFTAHAKDIFHESVNPDELRQKLSDASAVVTVSDFNVAFLRENYDGATERVKRIYNGLDLNDFPFQSPVERPPHIISVGRLVEKKGFGDLIEACAILSRRNQWFSCSIIGTGELEDELREQIVRLKLESTVKLLGPRPQADVIEAVGDAAVFAAPCVVARDANRDGLPTVLLEAMALGTPCISTDVTGIPEVVHHDHTGLVTPQRDPAALADAIERLLEDHDLRVRLATAARKTIEADFDIHQNAAKIRELILGDEAAQSPEATEALQEAR